MDDVYLVNWRQVRVVFDGQVMEVSVEVFEGPKMHFISIAFIASAN